MLQSMRSQRVGHDLASEQQKSQLIIGVGGQSHYHPPLCVGLSTPYDLSLDAILSTQFERLLKGKLGKRSGQLFITYSSFLLLLSTESISRLGKISCDQKI